MAYIKDELWKFGKAELSAGLATIVDFTLTCLIKICGVWYGYATFIGAVSGGVTNCMINYRWVFHSQGQTKKRVATRYLFVWIVSILLNTYGTYLLTELSGFNFIFIKAVVAIGVAILWNYQMQRLYVFHCNDNNHQETI